MTVLGIVAIVAVSFVLFYSPEIGERIRRQYLFRRHPHVYVCTVNRVTGVMLARDYEKQEKRFWRECRGGKREYPVLDPPIFVGSPVFLFSGLKFNQLKRSRIIGDTWELGKLLWGCQIEAGNFYIPPYDGDKPIWRAPEGESFGSGRGFWERLDRPYTFEEAYQHIHSFPFPRPGLEISRDGRVIEYEVSGRRGVVSRIEKVN